MYIGWNAIAQDAAGRAINFFPNLLSMTRVAGPWALFGNIAQPGEDSQESCRQETPKDRVLDLYEDYGLRASKQISWQLQNLKSQLYHGDFTPPDYGVDWKTLYRDSKSSIDTALGIFGQARSQLAARLGQSETVSSKEAMEILEMIIQVSRFSSLLWVTLTLSIGLRRDL